MQREAFIALIDQPEKLDNQTLKQLKSLADRFPYCQTSRLLYTKNLHNIQSLDYHSQLRLTAAYAPDREILYRLILKPGLTAKIQEVEGSVEPPVVAAALPTVPDSESLPEADTASNLPSLPEQKDLAALESEILRHAISASIALDAEAGEAELEKLPDETEQETSVPETIPSKPETIKPRGEERYSLSSWLMKLDGRPEEQTIEEEVTEIPTDASTLIDQFIQQDPQLTPARTEFFSPTNVAKLSLVDQDEFVTETLAAIYAKQGHIKKAIRAYEVLSLKFPEKSSYFAGRIRILKESNN